MSEIIAEGMQNDQRVITVKSISGDPVTLNEKIAEVVVDTGSGKQRCVAVKQFGGGGGGGGSVDDVQINSTSIVSDGVANIPVASQDTLGVAKVSPTYGLTVSNGIIVGSTKTESVYSTAANSLAVCKGTLDNIKDGLVRGVSPACTTITASDTTATLTANQTYAHALSSSGCTYTLTTPTDLTVYSGFILMLDTTNSASIAFQTDDSPATTISISGSPTIATGKKYTVTGQYSVINNAWELWIIEYNAS